MPDIKKTTVRSVIYIIAASVVAIMVSLSAGLYNELADARNGGFDYMNNFIVTYDSLLAKEHNEENTVRSDLMDMAKLTASAIRRSESDILPSRYLQGAIVRVGKTGIESAISLPEEITPAAFAGGDTGTADTETGTMVYSRIEGDLYYVEFSDLYETVDEVVAEGKEEALAALNKLAADHHCDYLYMEEAGNGTDDYVILTGTGVFGKYSRLSQLKIAEKDMDQVYDSLETGSHHRIRIEGKQYDSTFKKAGDGRAAAILIPVNKVRMLIAEQTVIYIAAFLVLVIVITSWVLFIYSAVKHHTIPVQDSKRYNPASVRMQVRIAVIFGAILIFCVCLFTQSIESVFKQTSSGAANLQFLFHRIDEEKRTYDIFWKEAQDRYTAKAERVALLLNKNQKLQEKGWIREASDIIGADYIMLFDSEGNEVLSDSRYRGLSLGTSEESPTYEFRRLLKGVQSISKAGLKDEVTGLTRDMHGVALRYLGDDDSYGALLLAVDPAAFGKRQFEGVNGIAKSMLTENAMIFAVDPKTKLIEYSTDPSLLSLKAGDVGLTKSELRSAYIGVLHIEGIRYYITSDQHNKRIYYYGERRDHMAAGNLRYAALMAVLSLLLLSGLSIILLTGYKEECYAENVRQQELPENAEVSTVYPSKEELLKVNLYSFDFMNREASPDERTGSVLLLCIAAVLIPLLLRMHFGGNSLGETSGLLTYIGKGEWERSFNIFAVSAAMALFCHAAVLMISLRFFINVAGNFLGAKAHTVASLMYNILFCVTMLACLLLSMEYFGVNTRAVVASLGLAGLAASLGAKDLVSDVIAGITLMLDGSYKVGDNIEIDGYEGVVVKINMRNTSVLHKHGCVRIFSNSTISNVSNYSIYPCIVVVRFTLPIGCRIETAEEILKRELPKLKSKSPLILRGPTYKGVAEVGMNSMGYPTTTIAVSVYCNNLKDDATRRFLNREIRLMFEDVGEVMFESAPMMAGTEEKEKETEK